MVCSVDRAAWPTAPGSSTEGCGSMVTPWVGAPALLLASRGPPRGHIWVGPCPLLAGAGQLHERSGPGGWDEEGSTVPF